MLYSFIFLLLYCSIGNNLASVAGRQLNLKGPLGFESNAFFIAQVSKPSRNTRRSAERNRQPPLAPDDLLSQAAKLQQRDDPNSLRLAAKKYQAALLILRA